MDSELLRSNNLICPLDYTTVHTPVVKTPKGIISLTYKVKTYSNNQITCYNTVIFPFFAGTFTPGFAQPTVSYNMHICTEPQDDGYTPLPPPAHTSLLEQSEETLTLPSSPESCSMKDTEVCLWTLFHFPHIKGSRMTFIFLLHQFLSNLHSSPRSHDKQYLWIVHMSQDITSYTPVDYNFLIIIFTSNFNITHYLNK